MNIKKVVLYARVSTRESKYPIGVGRQDTENQLIQLREYCIRQGWEIIQEYIDRASGKSSDRDEFKKLFEDARLRKFDLVMFWSLDRFSREGVLETLQHLQKLTSYKVEWKSYTEQYLDSLGIFRDAVLAILASIAKQERVRISERTIAGIERARVKGTRTGRPIGREKVIMNIDKAVELAAGGMSLRKIADQLGVKKSTVENRLKERGFVRNEPIIEIENGPINVDTNDEGDGMGGIEIG